MKSVGETLIAIFAAAALALFVSGCDKEEPPKADAGTTHPDLTAERHECIHTGSGRDLTVGPSQKYSSLSDVPWDSLGPGDTVRIFYRPEPYREKIIISGS